MRRAAALVSMAVAAALSGRARAAPVCSINSISGLPFGTYDPFSASDNDSVISGTYTCAAFATVTVSKGNSTTYSPRKVTSGANALSYNVFRDSARTEIIGDGSGGTFTYLAPPGTNIPFTTYGRVFVGQDVPAGTYADVLVVTFTPVGGGSPATSNVNVSTTVVNNCTVSTSTLSFGAYDPVVANAGAPLDRTGSVVLTCTKGATTTIAIDTGVNASGSQRRVRSGTTLVNYDLYQDAARTVPWGSGATAMSPAAAPSKAARTFTVYGRVPAGQDAPASPSYTDTLTVTVNF